MAKFAPGKTTETELVPLTPYWDDHMCKLDIHIPLTVFDVDWISRDLLVAVKKASKSKDRPTGQLPKSEWWMSYSDWTRSTRLFLEYLREVYHHDEFANALEKHFAYVVKLDERHCWVTAFRYDIAVRSNVMCHHVEGAVADLSVKRPIFLESAKAKTDSYKDGWLIRHDNRKSTVEFIFIHVQTIEHTHQISFISVLAYIKGGVKERFNPLTGLRYERLQTHDANEPEDNPAGSTSSNTTSKEHYSVAKRGRGGYFKKVEDRTKWRGRGRENSPYQRPNVESGKTAEMSKGTDKQ